MKETGWGGVGLGLGRMGREGGKEGGKEGRKSRYTKSHLDAPPLRLAIHSTFLTSHVPIAFYTLLS